ncbi:hypothetical protein CEXT_507451 [Caerostris extrusa]|uniref:Uncharacterized protein n=1 Tax=Caerostris extrusa TaxID=172846 RepID=A0AAV4N9V1_CAEEX|nr:hypothetical protein CEXT_507451 [Caerostris extrusa]
MNKLLENIIATMDIFAKLLKISRNIITLLAELMFLKKRSGVSVIQRALSRVIKDSKPILSGLTSDSFVYVERADINDEFVIYIFEVEIFMPAYLLVQFS